MRPHGSLDFSCSVVIVVVAEGDICALFREGPGDCRADSPAAAGDEGGPVLKPAVPAIGSSILS
jgi:hypothetical protein